jgi:hypothetical protein
MPEATCYLATQPPEDDLEQPPESQLLLLPLKIPPSIQSSNPHTADVEHQLRYAQATNTITELQQSLTVSVSGQHCCQGHKQKEERD